jgi:uncharacterized protein YuzE
MDTVKIYYDEVGQTLTVWFGDPQSEYLVEETESEVLIMKNERGEVIGFERLHFVPTDVNNLQVELLRV